MSDPQKVCGFVASAASITLYFADGTNKSLPNNDWETKRILATIVGLLAANPEKPVDLNLQAFSLSEKLKSITGDQITVDGNGNSKIATRHGSIDDGGALTKHIKDAIYGDGAKGFKRFTEKFQKIKRAHTAKELLTFMKDGDLPIADDGSIIGFKVLTKNADGKFRDPHTGKIPQQLGSLVYMPASKVDDNRRVLCSTGLHICSRSYLRGFMSYNSALTLVKIQPKDVISVPIGETSKMRVSAYHICAVIPGEIASLISKRSASEDCKDFDTILADVIVGYHPPVLETVEVTGLGDFKITEVKKVPLQRKIKTSRARRAIIRPKIDPKTVKAMARKAVAEKTNPYDKKLVKAQRLFDRGHSIRAISAQLGMDRESLGKNLDRSSKRKA